METSRTAQGVDMMRQQAEFRLAPEVVKMQLQFNAMQREIMKILEISMDPPIWMYRTMDEVRATLRGLTRSRNMKRFKHPFRRY